MHSKYDIMYTNRIFNVLNFINNHVSSCINSMLSVVLVELAILASLVYTCPALVLP